LRDRWLSGPRMGKPAPHFRMTGLSNRTKASRLSTARENPPRGNPSFEPWLGGQHRRGPCDGNCAPRRACHRAARVARTWSVHPSSLMAPGLSGFARKPVSREDHESICLWPNPATPGEFPECPIDRGSSRADKPGQVFLRQVVHDQPIAVGSSETTSQRQQLFGDARWYVPVDQVAQIIVGAPQPARQDPRSCSRTCGRSTIHARNAARSIDTARTLVSVTALDVRGPGRTRTTHRTSPMNP
jgi:hypothetical protein